MRGRRQKSTMAQRAQEGLDMTEPILALAEPQVEGQVHLLLKGLEVAAVVVAVSQMALLAMVAMAI